MLGTDFACFSDWILNLLWRCRIFCFSFHFSKTCNIVLILIYKNNCFFYHSCKFYLKPSVLLSYFLIVLGTFLFIINNFVILILSTLFFYLHWISEYQYLFLVSDGNLLLSFTWGSTFWKSFEYPLYSTRTEIFTSVCYHLLRFE